MSNEEKEKEKEREIIKLFNQGHYIWELAQRMDMTENEIVAILEKRFGKF